MEKIRGGEEISTGVGLDGREGGGCVEDFIDYDTGKLRYEKAECP